MSQEYDTKEFREIKIIIGRQIDRDIAIGMIKIY